MADVILFVIWVVFGLVIGTVAASIWKDERPYGELADYGLSVLLAVGVGILDWYLVAGWLGIEGALKFILAISEPPLASLVGLWILRKVKR
jgi:uncharacterized membrane protein YeaQ/YmgE (transglycosylase-associated protein family)